jgi:large subunit ribosomal protein L7/L12
MTEETNKPAESPTDDKAENKQVEVPAKFKNLVSEIEKMPIVELAELVKVLEEKFGVSAAAPVAAAASGTGEAVEEKTSFNVELKEVGAQKIEVIKVVRDATGKGLKESKDLVDAAVGGTAQIVTEGIKKEDAEALKKKFEAAGAKAEIK